MLIQPIQKAARLISSVMRTFDNCYKAQLVDLLYRPQHLVVGLVKQKL
jgi:hypothetical protein